MLSRAVRTVVLTPPWWFRGSALDLDFLQNRAAVNSASNGSAVGQLTLTRATAGYAQWASGQWTSFASGAFRITDKGLLIEEARTNSALWSRDMTNAAWVKVNMTAALNAVGIDNMTNSATTLTATAGNATILQAVVDISEADTYSVWLKRGSGTGAVNISLDGATWTAVTLTSAFQQFQLTSTLLNPNCGIQITASGDSVIADFNQLELNKSFATSPILTTSAAVTRNGDKITGLTNAPAIGAVLSYTVVPFASILFAQRCIGWAVGADSANNSRLVVRVADVLASGVPIMAVGTGAAVVTLSDTTTGANITTKTAAGWNSSSSSFAMQGRTAVTSANGWNAQATPFSLGGDSGAGAPLNGYIQRFVVWNTRLPDSYLSAITTP